MPLIDAPAIYRTRLSPAAPRVSQFLALSLVGGSWGHAGDAWFVDLGR
jgi:hypothetical protein